MTKKIKIFKICTGSNFNLVAPKSGKRRGYPKVWQGNSFCLPEEFLGKVADLAGDGALDAERAAVAQHLVQDVDLGSMLSDLFLSCHWRSVGQILYNFFGVISVIFGARPYIFDSSCVSTGIYYD